VNEYKTQDIVLAASLKINNFELIRIEKTGSKGTFVFRGVDPQFILDFDLEKIMVRPIEFSNTIKQLTTSVRRIPKN